MMYSGFAQCKMPGNVKTIYRAGTHLVQGIYGTIEELPYQFPKKCQEILACCYKLVMGGPKVCPSLFSKRKNVKIYF